MATIGSILIDGQDPDMGALRRFLASLDARVAVTMLGLRVFRSIAELNAFVPGGAEPIFAFVADGVAFTGYRFSAGAWVADDSFVQGLANIVQPLVDEAQSWAEGTGEPGGVGTKSAKAWSQDAANSRFLNGAGKPAIGLGAEGQFYIDSTEGRLFGPKSGGAWPARYYQLSTRVGIYDPGALFLGGQKGVLYDVSDAASLWQDVAGTIPANVGQVVARIDDKSGNGLHLIQPAASKRAIYSTDGNAYWLEFDGVDDCYATAENLDLASPQVSHFVALQYADKSALHILFELSANFFGGNPGAFYMSAPDDNSGRFGYGRSGASGANAIYIPSSAPPQDLYFTGQMNLAGNNHAEEAPVLRVNGIDAPRQNGSGGGDTGPTSNFQPYPLYVGARNQSSAFFKGRLYALVIRAGLTDNSLVADVETFTRAAAGLTPAEGGGTAPVAREAGKFYVNDYGAAPYLTQAAALAGTDSTLAIQAAIDACYGYGGGSVEFDPAYYKISRSLRTDRRGNSQIALPDHQGNKISIKLNCDEPAVAASYTYDPGPSQAGAILISTLTGLTYTSPAYMPSVIGSPTNNGSSLGGAYTNLHMTVHGIAIRVPDNPTLSGFDFGGVLACHMEDYRVDTHGGVSGQVVEPTHPWATGFLTPKNANNVFGMIGQGTVIGMFVGRTISEHSQLYGSHHTHKCKVALMPFTPFNHPAHIGGMENVEGCPYLLADCDYATGPRSFNSPAVINLAFLDIEDFQSGWPAPIKHILDANNYLSGKIVYGRVIQNVGYTEQPLTVAGCQKLRFEELSTGSTAVIRS